VTVPAVNIVDRTYRKEARLTPARLASACVVAAFHVAFVCWLVGRAIDPRRPAIAAEPIVAEILVATRSELPTAGAQLNPIEQTIQLEIPNLPISAEPDMTIDAPRIDPSLTVDIAPYSARADLMPGFVATVLLLLEVAPDGSVISAEIVRSNAGDAANAAAIQYAHATRWMPGKVGGEARAMQASLTVILGERG
jgi:TonB family protein